MLAKYRERRAAKAQERLAEDTFNEAFGQPSFRHIRRWSLEELHRRLATGELHAAERRMAEGQVRMKEAWRTPARWTFIAAIIAIVISILGLLL